MQIRENISLRPYNTFSIEATAKYFTSFENTDKLREILTSPLFRSHRHFVLGGGSNILLTGDFNGLVLKNEIAGIEQIAEDKDYVYLKAGAGVNWHRLVMHCVENNLAGMENLSLIPGSTGASPMQNIGAYGVEIKDIFQQLEAFHIQDKAATVFSLADCEFGYRESIFKRKYKGQFIILNVTFRLKKKPDFNVSYGAIQQELETMGVKELSIQAIAQAVINIRSSKLPDPRQVGNAGSFFKNPQIDKAHFAPLQTQFPNAPFFPVDEQHVKIPAGWLIEQCGWKGYRLGDAGCYARQALVLVNYGHASGQEILALSERIVQSVQEKFSIHLEREVNIV